MATSPNFSWPEPDNTDLVKNGALAIRTAVDAIDASMVDLKGGTTGQVLKKNTNTDMDFVWSADSAGMTNPMTTTGDTIYSSSGSTPARLGIGSTGQVLTVASGVPSWATPATATSGFTYITSSTFSNVATASITGCFTSTYYNYFVTFQDMGAATANDDLEMVFITAAPADSTSHYGGYIFLNIDTPAISSGSFKATAKMKLTSSTGLLTSNDYGSGFMYVSQVGVSGRPRINGQYINNAEGYPTSFGAMVGATGTFTGMKFSTSSSNITGKITVYGLAVS
jgi:hypothetical protein